MRQKTEKQIKVMNQNPDSLKKKKKGKQYKIYRHKPSK